MAVDSVSGTNASAVVSAAAKYVKQVSGSGSTSGASTALEESTETHAETVKEASKGDQVAKRLLAKQDQQKELENPTPAQELGKSQQIDQKA